MRTNTNSPLTDPAGTFSALQSRSGFRAATARAGRTGVLALLGGGAMLAQAQTQTGEPASPLSANVTLASQYVARGFRQTWGEPAVQSGFDYADPSGFSVGTWMSNVSNRYIENGTVEWDLYGNYSASLGDLGYSIGYYQYIYPGAEYVATKTKYDYGELSLGASYKAFYLKYNVTVTQNFFGIADARGTEYVDIGANIEVFPTWMLNLHAGQGDVASHNEYSWRDYKVGVTKMLSQGWSVVGAYTRAHGKTDIYEYYQSFGTVSEVSNLSRGTFVVALTRTF